MAKRKFEVEISENRKGDGFKESEREATRWGKKLGDEGEKAGDKLAKGVRAGTDKVGSTLESAGSAAGDLFSSGFDPSSIADVLADAMSSSTGKLGTAAAGAGLAAAAAFTTGLMNGMETEAATDRLAAQLGGSEWAQDMGAVAGDLYTQGFGESVADTAGTLRSVLQRGILPEDATDAQIERMTGRFLTFTDVMEQDLDMTTQAVSNMLRTRLAEDGTEALDILTRGIQQGADRAGDLQETFQEYSTMFRDVGLSGSQAMGLIIQGLQAGARDADTVADAIKEFAIRAQDGSETSKAGFEAIGLSARDMTDAVARGGPGASAALDQVLDRLRNMEDPAKRNAAAVALFGTKAEDLGDALFNLDLDTAASMLGDTAGATDKLGEAYDNNSAKIEAFRRQALEQLTNFVGQSVLPKLDQLKAWAQDNPVAFQIIAGVIGTVLVVAFAAWAASAASAAVATIAATWPILAIGAAVIALAALIVIHWNTIKSVTIAAFNAVKGAIMGAFNWVKTNWPLILAILTGPIGLAVLAIARNWQTIKDGATAVKDWIGNRVSDIAGFFTSLPGTVADAFSGLGSSIIDGIKSLWNSTVGGFGFTVPSWVPGVGGRGFHIPELAEGGIVTRPTLALIGEAGPEAVLPLDRRGVVSGGGGVVNINFYGNVYGIDDFEHAVAKAIDSAGARGVPITINGRRL